MYVYIYLLASFRIDCHSPGHLRQAMPNLCCESKVTCRQIFIVEIWYFARTPHESIDWDHPLKSQTSKSPCMQSPKSQCQNHVFTTNFRKLRLYQNKGLFLGEHWRCLTHPPHVTKLPDLRIKIFAIHIRLGKMTFFSNEIVQS